MKIGIIGAGFTGTTLAAVLKQLSPRPLEIFLYDKTGRFGAGPAYNTPYAHHLLNVRAKDMSAFVDQPNHFVDWICAQPELTKHFDKQYSIAEQFAPRCAYYQYLQSLLAHLHADNSEKFKFKVETAEIVDIELESNQPILISNTNQKTLVDKVVLALGNNPPASFPFPIDKNIQRIDNPWDYEAVRQINSQDDVLIVGTGLSMIDAVLTLHNQQHTGMIYAVSRHGLLPLPHSDVKELYPLDPALLTNKLRILCEHLRLIAETHQQVQGDWRSILNALRLHAPDIWQKLTVKDQKTFLRHLLPYWNIHRHRVHTGIMQLLAELKNQGQLRIFSGRVLEVKQNKASLKLRHTQNLVDLKINGLINCMGPRQIMKQSDQPLISALLNKKFAMLDPLQLGFAITSNYALKNDAAPDDTFFALGAMTKGALWEINAVPDLRNQVFKLARHLLAIP